MKTELIKAEEQTERKYPYLATFRNTGCKAIFIDTNKGFWLNGKPHEKHLIIHDESCFDPLPKGSKIILIQE